MSHVDLWLVFHDARFDDRLLSEYRALLSEDERGHEARFYFARDRERYVIARALLRTTLSRYRPIEAAAWQLRTNEYGRPEILCEGSQPCELRFNISHTCGLIVLAVSERRDVGVDVENLQVREISLDVARRFFAGAEVDDLCTVPLDRQQERLFEYWTLKESYIKARGMGLSIPLGYFSFHFPTERAMYVRFDPRLQDVPSRWVFRQYRIDDGYMLAVCSERVPGVVPSVTIREVVPMLCEDAVALELLRSSEATF